MTGRTAPPARPWLLVSTADGQDAYGAPVPAGTAIARQMWNGVTPWRPPEGVAVVPDDGRPIWQPQPPAAPADDTLDAADWLARVPRPVLIEVARAALGEPRLLLALLLLAARGRVDRADPTGELRALLGLATARTAGSPDPLTPALACAMLAA